MSYLGTKPANNVATNQQIGAGAIDTTALADNAVTPVKLSQKLTQGTAQVTTSGTSVDVTGIPSWVKRITILFNGVSTTASSNVIMQIGTGATPTYVTTGYNGSCAQYNGGSVTAYTTGFLLAVSGANSNTYAGVATFVSFGSNVWMMQSSLGRSDAANGIQGAGSLSAGAVLTALRLTTAGGTDTFDAGSINILYE